jgi:hypothetical protein
MDNKKIEGVSHVKYLQRNDASMFYDASKVAPKLCAVLIRKLKAFQRVGKVERIREKNIIIIITFHLRNYSQLEASYT